MASSGIIGSGFYLNRSPNTLNEVRRKIYGIELSIAQAVGYVDFRYVNLCSGSPL